MLAMKRYSNNTVARQEARHRLYVPRRPLEHRAGASKYPRVAAGLAGCQLRTVQSVQ